MTTVTSIVVDLSRCDMQRVKNLRFVDVVAKIACWRFEDGSHRSALVVTQKVFDIFEQERGRTLPSRGTFLYSSRLGRDSSAKTFQRGNGSGMSASAYPITAMAAAFSRSSCGTILSSVSAAVWW